MAFRFRALAAAGALTLPAAALMTLLPGVTAAQASTTCAENQATITTFAGDTICQSQGEQNYILGGPRSIVSICAGTESTVVAEQGLGVNPVIEPGQCKEYPIALFPVRTTVIVFS